MSEITPFYQGDFEVKVQDETGKKYENVSRYKCVSTDMKMEMILDVNTDVYDRLKPGIRFSAALVEKLYENEPNYYNPLVNIPSLADKFEYVTHGKIFKFVEADKKLCCFTSFGGLLLMLKSAPEAFSKFKLNTDVYLLIRVD